MEKQKTKIWGLAILNTRRTAKYTVSVAFVINFHRLFNYGDYFDIYTQTN